MTFHVKTAYIGPYLVSSLTGAAAGDLQKLRYNVPSDNALIAQGTFVMTGRLRANWSASPSGSDQDFGVGSHFTLDRLSAPRPLTLNEDLTLTALEDNSGYVCVAAVGIEQFVNLKRVYMRAGEEIVANRYDLLLVGGKDAAVRVDGGEVKTGPRFVYAKTKELVIRAEKDTIIGVASFEG